MPAAVTQETRDTVKKRLEDGVKTRDIAAEFNFSISKVRRFNICPTDVGTFQSVMMSADPRCPRPVQ